MVKNHRSDKAVSEVVSYILTFIIVSVVVVATILTTNSVVDSRAKVAATIQAQTIANQVAEGILSTVLLKQEFPDANYSNTIDIPYQLASSSLNGLGRPYYIEASGTRVYVNSTDDQIIENSTSYNIGELYSGISGKVYSGSGKLKFECLKNDFLYKFDFGMDFVRTELGYDKISDGCTKTYWPQTASGVTLPSYKYRTKISVTNPTGSILSNYPVLVQLNPTNFDYNLAKSDGSDIMFLYTDPVTHTSTILPYWIETWNPHETSASRVWVKFNSLPVTDSKTGTDFYIYYGIDGTASLPNYCNSGKYTFLFFDNFSGSTLDTTNNWVSPYTSGGGEVSVVNGCLKLKGVSAVRSISQFGSSPYVIEAKVRTVRADGDLLNGYRDASIFVGADTSAPPYSKGYMLSSGCGSDWRKNFGILENGNFVNLLGYVNVAMDEKNWNRLTYTVNGKTSFICRYNYTYFTIDSSQYGDASIVYDGSSSTTSTTGYFGLCNTVLNSFSYCDWIFVHPYNANPLGTTAQSAIPIAYVGASSSINYYWTDSDIPILKSSKANDTKDTIGTDFVYCYNQPTPGKTATFNIKGVEKSTQYMIIFSMIGYLDDDLYDTIPGYNKSINNVKVIVADGASSLGELDNLIVAAGSHKKFSLLVKTPDTATSGTLAITFSDSDSGTEYYWNVCMLTIERGGMKIKIADG